MEIEKKYLLSKLPFDLSAYEKWEIKQGYISVDPVIRIRQSNDSLVLTVKGPGHYAREEYELALDTNQFQNLLSKVENNMVEKTRYRIPLEGGLWAELDIYHGFLQGLLTVEVEFSSLAEGEAFSPPSWFGKDVTTDQNYKNSNLSLGMSRV